MLSSDNNDIQSSKQRLGRKIAQLSLLLAIVGYSFYLFDSNDYQDAFTDAVRRSMLVTDDGEVQGEVTQGEHSERRRLSDSYSNTGHPTPPLADVADSLYIVKPVIGYAPSYTMEPVTPTGPTKLDPLLATASSQTSSYMNYAGQGYAPNVLDGSTSTNWRSRKTYVGVAEYLTIDLGIPEDTREVQFTFPQSGNMDFEFQSSPVNDYLGNNGMGYGNENGTSYWKTLETVTGFTGTSVTFNGPYDKTDRYLRIYFTGGHTLILGGGARRLTEDFEEEESVVAVEQHEEGGRRLTEEDQESAAVVAVVQKGADRKKRNAAKKKQQQPSRNLKETASIAPEEESDMSPAIIEESDLSPALRKRKLVNLGCGSSYSGSTAGLPAASASTCGTSIGTGGHNWHTISGVTGCVTVSTCHSGTNYDSKLSVYQGISRTCVGGIDDAGGTCGTKAAFHFQSSGASTTYDLLVHGFGAGEGSYTVTIDCNPTCPTEITLDNAPPPTPPPTSPPTQAPGKYFSVSTVNVWRQPRAISSTPTSTYCGDSVVAGKDSLLQSHGGTLDTLYENIEFFSASMTPAQALSMKNDPCAFAVEPNWVVRPRGRTRRIGNDPQDLTKQEEPQAELPQVGQLLDSNHRGLGIPEFNMEDDEPGNWGLERISTRGRRNGKYIWVSEGFGTNIYFLDTGIYPDSQDWIGRNVTFMNEGPSRVETPYICAGDANDLGNFSDHGTHVASNAAGWKYGVAKMTAIRPIQVIDGATGTGSVASILCGLEKVAQDGIDYAIEKVVSTRQLRAVINLSVGVNGRSDILDQAAKDMTDLGYTTVIAVGDSPEGEGGGNSCHFSPNHPDAIRVGALSDAPGGTWDPVARVFTNGQGDNPKAPDSNYGECIDIWAPGDMIMGATNTGEYDISAMNGTSVAAAFVSGTATMFLEELLDRLDVGTPMEGGVGVPSWPAKVKAKMLSRAEKGGSRGPILGDLGRFSPDVMLQTTSSACQANWHCDVPGETCMYDGVCGDMSKYF